MTTEHQQVALVTGAGSGVGRAVAVALHAAGYAVVLAGWRMAELEKTAAMCTCGVMLAISTDVRQLDSIRRLCLPAYSANSLAASTCFSTMRA